MRMETAAEAWRERGLILTWTDLIYFDQRNDVARPPRRLRLAGQHHRQVNLRLRLPPFE